ncbi:hypothetical protein DSO57_1034383 [Entomophthora muscae]|uniref:Uncharacterized protein n=1 Tax=Entomophthora muscae TaxID=34485 RepID=A0ACC2S233_9FUNG|nr:hypothetical protein DSO57_1034383 [Entomophthora muscae]
MSAEELEKVRQLLVNVLDRCNQSDMALAKQWILSHCQTTKTLGKLFYILWGLRQPKKFDTTLRVLYLANDLLFHEKKHSSAWIIPELIPHLAPLSNEASMLAGSPAQREQLSKLVELWERQKCLTVEQISHIRNAMLPPEAKSFLPPPAMVPYYKVPAGFMVELCKDFKTPYTPIPVRDASVVPMLPLNAAADLASALTDFYEGMDAALFKPNLPPPTTSPLEWQPGFLDKWQSELQNKLHLSSRSTSCSTGRSRERSYSRSVSRSPSRASYSSRDSRSPRRRAYPSHRSRSRSYSSRSRSVSPNRNPGTKRTRSQSSSRSRSPKRSLNYSRSPDARRYFRN